MPEGFWNKLRREDADLDRELPPSPTKWPFGIKTKGESKRPHTLLGKTYEINAAASFDRVPRSHKNSVIRLDDGDRFTILHWNENKEEFICKHGDFKFELSMEFFRDLDEDKNLIPVK